MKRSAGIHRQSKARVVNMKPDHDAGDLYHIPQGSIAARVDLQQDKQGRLYLTRASVDGHVQPYALTGHDGKPLRVETWQRPS